MQDSRKVALFWLAAFGVVLVIVGAWFWWDRVQTNPQNVFWQTLSQGLATQSTTIEATQSQSGATAHQTTAYTLGTKNIAHALVTLKQGQSTIKTEVIGTTDTDYTRYTAIDAGKSGKQLKTSSVLNVWARSDGTQQSANQASSNQLLREAALGVGLPLGSVPVPIANLTSAQRADLLQQMRDNQTYQTDFSKVGKTHENGRLYYTYEVNIQPILYVDLMKAFAKDVGFHDLDKVDPNTYQNVSVIKVKLTMDVRAHHLSRVDYEASGFTQTYTGYDVPLDVQIPQHSITAAELQKRLQAL